MSFCRFSKLCSNICKILNSMWIIKKNLFVEKFMILGKLRTSNLIYLFQREILKFFILYSNCSKFFQKLIFWKLFWIHLKANDKISSRVIFTFSPSDCDLTKPGAKFKWQYSSGSKATSQQTSPNNFQHEENSCFSVTAFVKLSIDRSKSSLARARSWEYALRLPMRLQHSARPFRAATDFG